MNGWVVLLWSFVAALVLIIGGIFGSLVVMGRVSLFPEAVPTAVPTPEETGVDTSISVLILNGTPDEGSDTQMRDLLINNGWASDIVFAGDSSSQDFPRHDGLLPQRRGRARSDRGWRTSPAAQPCSRATTTPVRRRTGRSSSPW